MEGSYGINTCACFTGHRDITDEAAITLKEKLREAVISLSKKGIVNFYAGGALGFDFLASVAVLNLKKEIPSLTLNLALPCRDYNKKWKSTDKALFELVKNKADSVVYVCENYNQACMHIRNKYMVDRSSYCVAYKQRDEGGSASTVDYALKRGLSVINLADGQISQLTFL